MKTALVRYWRQHGIDIALLLVAIAILITIAFEL